MLSESANEGVDLVYATLSWTLGANMENLTLRGAALIDGTGNALDNVLTGNAAVNTLTGGVGNDTLNGAAGNDILSGGLGNDTYVVDSTNDVINEAANEGVDLAQASVTYALSAEVENLTLIGTSVISGTGNTLDNVLSGNSAANTLTGGAGNDTLNGGAGIDTLLGGAGNDIYVVDSATDILTENLGEGTDTVQSSVTLTLANNLENLSLTGASLINGTGNALDNLLTGNTAANVLTGAAGNDTLNGGAGADTLIGGTGADLYHFNAGHGIDTIQENDATLGVKDAVQFVGTIKQADVQFKQVGNNLEVLLTASLDKLVMQNWYLGSQYHVEEFRFSDGTVLLNTQAQLLVSAMASFNAPTSAIESSPLHRPMHNHMIGSHMLSPPMTA